MMDDSVNMSLDDIIKQNRIGNNGNYNKNYNNYGGNRNQNRGHSQSRANTPGRTFNRANSQSRSRSRNRSRSRQRSQSRQRSRSRSRSRSQSRGRSQSRSRSQSRAHSRTRFTPRMRAGLEDPETGIPELVRGGYRGGYQNQIRRSNSFSSKNGQYNYNRNNQVRSQMFTRSRNYDSDLTVSVSNNFAKHNNNYLNKNSLTQLNKQYGYQKKSGPGSVKSNHSNRSYNSNNSMRSYRSNHSNKSSNSMRSYRSNTNKSQNSFKNYQNKQNYQNRQNFNNSNGSVKSHNSNFNNRKPFAMRGVGNNFAQMLDPELQKEIAALQGKTPGQYVEPTGVDFAPTPAVTGKTLHKRFAGA